MKTSRVGAVVSLLCAASITICIVSVIMVNIADAIRDARDWKNFVIRSHASAYLPRQQCVNDKNRDDCSYDTNAGVLPQVDYGREYRDAHAHESDICRHL